jgi:hypothetical protein
MKTSAITGMYVIGEPIDKRAISLDSNTLGSINCRVGLGPYSQVFCHKKQENIVTVHGFRDPKFPSVSGFLWFPSAGLGTFILKAPASRANDSHLQGTVNGKLIWGSLREAFWLRVSALDISRTRIDEFAKSQKHGIYT